MESAQFVEQTLWCGVWLLAASCGGGAPDTRQAAPADTASAQVWAGDVPTENAVIVLLSMDHKLALDARTGADGVFTVDAPPETYSAWIAHPSGYWRGELDLTHAQG